MSQKLEGHDVALVVGAPVFRYYPCVAGSYLPPGLELLHISDDPAETSRAPVGESLIGDSKLALAALAERDTGRNRPVLAVIGDGSFQYSVQAIWTAAQLQLPLLFVVLSNEEYCILKSFSVLEEAPGVPGFDIPGFDIVSLARGYACSAARVETTEAIQAEALQAWKRNGPTVLEIPITKTIPPLI